MNDNWIGIEEVVAIADTGSFAGAARKLELSPSHVSRAVNQIEKRMGVQLFQRTTRSVSMTEAGRFVVNNFRRLIEDRNDAFVATQSLQIMSGEIRITCSVVLGERFVEPLLRRFIQDHPMISVRLELTNRLLDLVSESYDVAIRTGQPNDNRIAAQQIAKRSLAVLAAPSYIQRHGAPKNLDDLCVHECLIGTNTSWRFSDGQSNLTINPKGRWRCNNGNAIMQAAIAGIGICQLPEYYAKKYMDSGDLVPLLETFKATPEAIWAVYPTERIRIPKVRQLIDYIAIQLRQTIS